MKNWQIILVLHLLVILTLAFEEPYKKIIHGTDPQARCLDGTSPALYLHEGGNKKTIVVYFVGGGFCGRNTTSQTLQNCYQMSKTDLGTSSLWPSEMNSGGFLSTDPALSKFASWTKFFFIPCDGAMHQGSTNVPIKYKDSEIYFRGADNTRSHLKWISANYDLPNAEKVIVAGGSAGGVATSVWSNYIRNLLKDQNSLYTIIDSGVFLNVSSVGSKQYIFDSYMKNLFRLSNLDESTPLEACNRRYSLDDRYKCMFIENSFTSIVGKTLLINSQYDPLVIQNLLQISCPKQGTSGSTLSECNSTELQNIEEYRKRFLTFLESFLQFPKNSAWAISCSNHVYLPFPEFYDSPTQRVPQNTELSIRNAIEKFVLEQVRIKSIDAEGWPTNAPCAF